MLELLLLLPCGLRLLSELCRPCSFCALRSSRCQSQGSQGSQGSHPQSLTRAFSSQSFLRKLTGPGAPQHIALPWPHLRLWHWRGRVLLWGRHGFRIHSCALRMGDAGRRPFSSTALQWQRRQKRLWWRSRGKRWPWSSTAWCISTADGFQYSADAFERAFQSCHIVGVGLIELLRTN